MKSFHITTLLLIGSLALAGAPAAETIQPDPLVKSAGAAVATTESRPAATPKAASATGLPGASGATPVKAADPAVTVGKKPTRPGLADAVLQEEGNLDAEEAIRSYQGIVSEFDSRREEAANAVFRLGEIFRKQGLINEAKAQYGRILREFADFPQLVKPSQKLLFEERGARSLRARPGGSVASDGTGIELLQQEIQLVEGQLESMQKQVESGVMAPEQLVSVKRDLLDLRRKLAKEMAEAKDRELAMKDMPLAGAGESALTSGNAPRPVAGSEPRRSDPVAEERLSALKEQLAEARADLRARQKKCAEQDAALRSIQRLSPENWASLSITDQRFGKLKQEYEGYLLAGNNPATESVLHNIRTWIEKVYLPEMKLSRDSSAEELDRATKLVSELEHIYVTSLKKTLDEQAAKARKGGVDQKL